MITPLLHVPGAYGVPTTNALAGIPLAGRITSYEHSITAKGGFESARVQLALADVDEGAYWFNQLMASAVMAGPDAETLWEGFLTRVELSTGGKRRARGLDSMANRIACRYTNTNGTAATAAASNNTASQFRHGVKQTLISLNEGSSTEAANVQAKALASRAWPGFEPTTSVQAEQSAAPQLTLLFAGWYSTLGWLTTSSSATTTAVTTTQVDSLLTDYNSTNNWFSTVRRLTASGISATQYIASDTTYRKAIERLLEQGNGTSRYAWGVYEGRRFQAAPWAGASPSSITYVGDLGQAVIYTLGTLSTVAPWNVRPDAMYVERQLQDVAGSSGQVDTAGRQYIERVTFRLDRGGSWSLRLEGQSSDDVDATLAVINGKAA